jgi:hypothetical protein
LPFFAHILYATQTQGLNPRATSAVERELALSSISLSFGAVMNKSALTLLSFAFIAGCTVHVRGSASSSAGAGPEPAPVAAAPPPPAPAAPAPAATPATAAATPAPAAAPGAAGASASVSVSWGTWTASGGEKPNTTCKKESNKELCYDAVDNNCDGQIDEGCPGYRTTGNSMQFMIAWKIAVDLDLHVLGPDGKEVSFKVRDSGSLVLDKDCAGLVNGVDNCPDGKVENVFFPADRAVLKGRYKVWVEVADSRGQKAAMIPFFFGGKVGAQTFTVPFFVANKKGEKKTFEFDVI